MAVLTASAYQPLEQCQPSISEACTTLSAFSHRWKAVAEPRNLDDSAMVARGIWQNFLRKTVSPKHNSQIQLQLSILYWLRWVQMRGLIQKVWHADPPCLWTGTEYKSSEDLVLY